MGAASSFGLLWAIHISDGVLSAPWLAGGFLLSGLLAVLAAYRVRDEEIPRIAVLSAAFFVASLLHLPLGPTSVHLLLNGLVGVILGRRAPLAILIGLGLQAVLLGHGGFSTIGVNACVLTLPALLAAALFATLRRLPRFGRNPHMLTWLCGFLLGAVSVLATLILQAVVLLWGGAEDWHQIVWLVFYAHLPLVAVEGVVLGFTVNFLARVKPEMLGLFGDPLPSEPRPSGSGGENYSRTVAAPAERTLLLVVLTLFPTTSAAQAHHACADYTIRPDRQVQIDGWFDPGDTPMKGAQVRVFRPEQRLLAEGRMDDNGTFVFRFAEAEPLEVIVNAGAGHRTSFVIPREKLADSAASLAEADSSPPARETSAAPARREHGEPWRERFKDALVGVSFLLSVAALLLSWRTNRRLRGSQTNGPPGG